MLMQDLRISVTSLWEGIPIGALKSIQGRIDRKINPSALVLVMDCSNALIRKTSVEKSCKWPLHSDAWEIHWILKFLWSILRKEKGNYIICKTGENEKDSRKIWMVAKPLLHPCRAPPVLPLKSHVNKETISGPEKFANSLGSLFAEVGIN